jgi:hypothetical protein
MVVTHLPSTIDLVWYEDTSEHCPLDEGKALSLVGREIFSI